MRYSHQSFSFLLTFSEWEIGDCGITPGVISLCGGPHFLLDPLLFVCLF